MLALRYLYTTRKTKILYKRHDTESKEPSLLEIYVDASFAACHDTRRNVNGHVFLLNGSIFDIGSRYERIHTRSSTAAEIIALSRAIEGLNDISALIEQVYGSLSKG